MYARREDRCLLSVDGMMHLSNDGFGLVISFLLLIGLFFCFLSKVVDFLGDFGSPLPKVFPAAFLGCVNFLFGENAPSISFPKFIVSGRYMRQRKFPTTDQCKSFPFEPTVRLESTNR